MSLLDIGFRGLPVVTQGGPIQRALAALLLLSGACSLHAQTAPVGTETFAEGSSAQLTSQQVSAEQPNSIVPFTDQTLEKARTRGLVPIEPSQASDSRPSNSTATGFPGKSFRFPERRPRNSSGHFSKSRTRKAIHVSRTC